MAVKQPVFRYEPDYAVPPGQTLLETIESRGMTQADLARRTGRTPKLINEIVQGKAPITPDTALQFERVLGVPAQFWNNLESNYRSDKTRIEERRRLENEGAWLEKFPVSALIKLGAIQKKTNRGDQVSELLRFFGVASPSAWNGVWSECQVAYRHSPAFTSSPEALASWLRLGELAAERISCAPYSKETFLSALSTVRHLTTTPPDIFEPGVRDLCSEAGVAVAFVPELRGTHLSGAARWLSPDKALIQLSLRHNSDDHLWFAFFHEAGHVLRHGRKDIFVDDDGNGTQQEEEANRFARDFLIPPELFDTFIGSVAHYTKASILEFARQVGVAPGIVVGRLQHDKLLPHAHCNELKSRFTWATPD